MTDRPDQRLGPETERKALGRSQGLQTDFVGRRPRPISEFYATCNCNLPESGFTNCGHYTNVQYRDSEPNNTPENMYV